LAGPHVVETAYRRHLAIIAKHAARDEVHDKSRPITHGRMLRLLMPLPVGRGKQCPTARPLISIARAELAVCMQKV